MVRRRLIMTVLMVAAVAAPVFLLGHIRFYAQESRLPETGLETIRHRAVRDRVTIDLDHRGIPHVNAATVDDLWFAQGFVHARDRFLQMDLGRRMAGGRLAAVFGEAALPSDRKMRTLRLAAAAQRQVADLDSTSRRALERYAEGVNAALRRYGRWIAPEIWLLGVQPEPWRVEHSLSLGLLLELNLTWAMGEEMQRSAELAHFGRERAADLWGWSEAEQRRWIPPVDVPADQFEDGDAITPPFGGGSNSWAIPASMTATGRPILANDPHVGVAVPPTWYAVGLRAPGIHAVGASVAGVPGVLIGHNSRVAWGFTMSMMDDQDLFVLTVDESRERELVDDAWIGLRTVTERIDVRWRREPETLKVKISRHGPIVRDTLDTALALSWTALRGASPVGAFLKMLRSDDVEDLSAAWDGVAGPSMNLVAADVEGHVLRQVVGRQPQRPRGAGRLPAPGSNSRWAWSGLARVSDNPRQVDPAGGFVVTANHDGFSEGDYPGRDSFPADFASPWRYRRIKSVLASRTDWDVDGCVRLQGDVVSGRAVAVLKSLWPDLQSHGGWAARALLQWDGRMVRDRIEPYLLSRLMLDLGREVGLDEALVAGREQSPVGGERLLRLLAGGMSDQWWDDLRTREVEDRTAIINRCLDRLDQEDRSLTWGAVHQVDFSHPLQDFPLVGSLLRLAGNRRSAGVPGDGTTVNAFYWDSGQPFRVKAIPSMRFVADVGNWDESVLVLPLGQSGRPWSHHVVDQFSDWLEGTAETLPFSPAAIDASSRARLVLIPR